MAGPSVFSWEPGGDYSVVATLTEDYLNVPASVGNPNVSGYQYSVKTSPTISGNKYQVIGYWSANHKLVLAIRNVTTSGSFTEYVYDGTSGLPNIPVVTDDSHNVIALDIDTNGYIHLTYNNHVDPVNYRVSSNPVNTFDGTFGAETSLQGYTSEDVFTYPMFFRDDNDKLYLIYRGSGGSGNADTHLYEYDTSTSGWVDGPGTASSGLLFDGQASSVNFYHQYPFCSGEDIWFCGHLRDTTATTSNFDPFLFWYDHTITGYKQVDDTTQSMPASEANILLIHNHSSTTNEHLFLGLVKSLVIDSSGNPHLTFRDNRREHSDDTGGNARVYYHWKWNGSSWDSRIMDAGGSELINDTSTDTLYCLSKNSSAAAQFLTSNSPYTDWTAKAIFNQRLDNMISDPHRWRDDKKFEGIVFAASGATYPNLTSTPGSWYWDSSWPYRTKITVDYNKVSSGVTNLPLLLDLSHSDLSSHDFWSNVNSDGSDIRLTQSDGITELPLEVLSINTGTKTGEIWFNPRQVLDHTANNFFYMYYGNPSGEAYHSFSGFFGRQYVWQPTYSYACHMEDDTFDYAWHNGSMVENGGLPDPSGGKIGNSQYFNGSTSYGRAVHPTREPFMEFGSGDFSLEGWVAHSDNTAEQYMVQKGNISSGGAWFALGNSNSTNLPFFFIDDGTNTARADATGTTYADGNFHHWAAQRRGNSAEIYINGSSGTFSDASAVGSIDSSIDMVFGARTVGAGGFPPAAFLDGRIDELRIIKGSRAPEWWETQYNNQNNPETFMSLGAQEVPAVASSNENKLSIGGGRDFILSRTNRRRLLFDR